MDNLLLVLELLVIIGLLSAIVYKMYSKKEAYQPTTVNGQVTDVVESSPEIIRDNRGFVVVTN